MVSSWHTWLAGVFCFASSYVLPVNTTRDNPLNLQSSANDKFFVFSLGHFPPTAAERGVVVEVQRTTAHALGHSGSSCFWSPKNPFEA